MPKNNKKVIIDNPPKIEIDEAQLISAKFSNTGVARFKETVKQYTEELFKRASMVGLRQKAKDDALEISSSHVREATIEMNKRYGKTDKKFTFFQAGEYVCTAVVGAGASNLNCGWGIFFFGVALAIGIGLFVVRVTNQNR